MADKNSVIELKNVSRWYGEILGVNHISTTIQPGITGLLGSNGAGKSTIMNLICGLLKPSQGEITVFGEPIWNNPVPLRRLGYCAQYDSFYEQMTGYEFISSLLSIRGYGKDKVHHLTVLALEQLRMTHAMNKRIASYSKGMRQRVKVALAIADNPDILILDEPLNGLDAVGRHEMIELVKTFKNQGCNILISSHILHEIDALTNNILMLREGYLLAEGEVQEVRELLKQHPHRIYLRCENPRRLASLLFSEDGVVSIKLDYDGEGIIAQTYDLDGFYENLNNIVLDNKVNINYISVADENTQAVFSYLSGNGAKNDE